MRLYLIITLFQYIFSKNEYSIYCAKTALAPINAKPCYAVPYLSSIITTLDVLLSTILTMFLRRSLLAVGRRVAAKPITPTAPPFFTTSITRRKLRFVHRYFGSSDANCKCCEQEQQEREEIRSQASRRESWLLSKVFETCPTPLLRPCCYTQTPPSYTEHPPHTPTSLPLYSSTVC